MKLVIISMIFLLVTACSHKQVNTKEKSEWPDNCYEYVMSDDGIWKVNMCTAKGQAFKRKYEGC